MENVESVSDLAMRLSRSMGRNPELLTDMALSHPRWGHPALLRQSLRPTPRPSMITHNGAPQISQVASGMPSSAAIDVSTSPLPLDRRYSTCETWDCRWTLPDNVPSRRLLQVQYDWLVACTIRWSRNTPPSPPKAGGPLLTQSTADPSRRAQCRPHAYPTAELVVCLVG